MANLGTLAESVKKFPMTDLWMDSCGEEELDYGILRGIVGATSNPIIVGNVVKNEMDKWEPEIKKLIQDMPEATEDEIKVLVEKCSRGGKMNIGAMEVLTPDDMTAVYRLANKK